jgi:hypothetical protein
MLGCGGKAESIADASFDFATDDGRVSGSNSALRTRVSLAESVEADAISDNIAGLVERVTRFVEVLDGDLARGAWSVDIDV